MICCRLVHIYINLLMQINLQIGDDRRLLVFVHFRYFRIMSILLYYTYIMSQYGATSKIDMNDS